MARDDHILIIGWDDDFECPHQDDDRINDLEGEPDDYQPVPF